MKRFHAAVTPLVLGLGLAVVLAACSSASGAQPAAAGSPAAPGSAGSQIVARDIAFQQTSVSVDAGKSFGLVFVNQDSAPHNVAIYADASAANAVMVGEVIQAGQVSYTVPALAAGTYFFRCDVHPNMTGTITAK